MTLALFGCSLLLTACFLAWVPRRRTWFTAVGAGTLCGYLLHGFVTKSADRAGVLDRYDWLHGPLGEVTVTVVAAAAVTALCTASVRRAFRYVMGPDVAWALRGPESGPGAPSRAPQAAAAAVQAPRAAAAVSPGR
jgi:fucose 4-O-acetylase-like acetyltransferase